MEYIKLIRQPDINMIPAIKVTKDTDLVFENEDGTVKLNEGDYVVYCDEERGYIVPAQRFMTVDEAIKELECVLATTSPTKE